jgi:hypothetical protein
MYMARTFIPVTRQEHAMSAHVSAKDFEAAVAAMIAPRAKTAAPVRPALDVTKARGYSPALGAIYSPTDTVNFLADSLEAQGVVLVRESYGFRTRNAAERAADAALKMAAE